MGLLDNNEILFNEDQKKLNSWIKKQIDLLPQIYTVQKYENLSVDTLCNALLTLPRVTEASVAMEVNIKNESLSAKQEFDMWMAEKTNLIRMRENSNSPKSKWLSSTDIERIVKEEFKDEYSKLKTQVEICEMKVAFCRRRLDGIEAYQYSLQTCAKLLMAQMNELHAEKISDNLEQKIGNPLFH